MINKIKKLLEDLLVSNKILMNPSDREVMKEFRRASVLRFVVDLQGNYWVADASEYIHNEMIKKENIHKKSQEDVIEGFIQKEGVHGNNYFRLFSVLLESMAIYYKISDEKEFEDNLINYDSEFFKNIEDKIKDKFMESKIYQNLKNTFRKVIIK